MKIKKIHCKDHIADVQNGFKEKKVKSRLSRFLGSGIDILDHDHSGMLNDEDGQNN